MLKTNNWIYLDVEKTGCTFLRTKLQKIYGESHFENIQKHLPPLYKYDIPKIITIRKAESFYFSLWSYGVDSQGGFYKLIKAFYPEKIDKFYKSDSKDCFSYFLDFALSLPFRYPKMRFSRKNIFSIASNLKLLNGPNKRKIETQKNYISRVFLQQKWLPDSSDIYTSRILEMLIPKSERKGFIENLKADFSSENLKCNLKQYLPEIILRTSSLNEDFYAYYQKNKLDFLNLPSNWQEIFPLNSVPINRSKISSSKLKSEKLESYLSQYHRELIKCKSNISNFLLQKAEEKIKTVN